MKYEIISAAVLLCVHIMIANQVHLETGCRSACCRAGLAEELVCTNSTSSDDRLKYLTLTDISVRVLMFAWNIAWIVIQFWLLDSNVISHNRSLHRYNEEWWENILKNAIGACRWCLKGREQYSWWVAEAPTGREADGKCMQFKQTTKVGGCNVDENEAGLFVHA